MQKGELISRVEQESLDRAELSNEALCAAVRRDSHAE